MAFLGLNERQKWKNSLTLLLNNSVITMYTIIQITYYIINPYNMMVKVKSITS